MTDPERKSLSDISNSAQPIVPDHELIRVIGRGSSGQVWLARNALGTYRAVKVVHAQSFSHRRPFEREFNGILKFEPLSRLHDGLVDILQVGFNEAGGYFYCVMELADNVTREQTVNPETYEPRTMAHDQQRLKRLPIEECLRLGAGIASALGFLHKHGLTHRDIKPSNIIFVQGTPKLADIGLVNDVSSVKTYLGTEGFIPPEGSGSVSADIYALGKILYELSTGNDRNAYPALPADLDRHAEKLDLVEFNKIVLKACRSKPRDRFNTADDLLLELLNFQFKAKQLRKERRLKLLARFVAILGGIVAVIVVTSLIRRIIWFQQHGP